jgi:hypothetical protein
VQKYCRRSATGGDTGERHKQDKGNQQKLHSKTKAARPDSIRFDQFNFKLVLVNSFHFPPLLFITFVAFLPLVVIAKFVVLVSLFRRQNLHPDSRFRGKDARVLCCSWLLGTWRAQVPQ